MSPSILDTPCVLLAGGQSSRFGSDKGLADLRGKPLIAHVLSRLREQTHGQLAINCDASSPYAAFCDEVIPDQLGQGAGPLAGIHAALVWAKQNGWSIVATVPIDTPFIPQDYLQRLNHTGASSVATSQDGIQPVCGLWRSECADILKDQIDSGMRSVQDWIRFEGAREVKFETREGQSPFFNINTPEDLLIADAALGE
ncbi:MAG: molybdenum cofactor guanylyltransferase [Hyphomonadaceae bacterium]